MTTAPLAFAAGDTCAGACIRMGRAFAAAGIDTPDLDARILLCAVLGIDAAILITRPERPLGAVAAALTEAANRRLAREPVSRILGQRDFYGRTFKVTAATLDPRPDTETLVDAALAFAHSRDTEAPLRILDIGTGTGCLLVTLLAELPRSTGLGTDLSPEALAVAVENARRHGVSDRARWQITDGLSGIDTKFDLLVTNPPYVRSGEITGLAPEVRHFDPPLALDGGADGLDLYRRITVGIPSVVPVGCALFEVGHDQAGDVSALLQTLAVVHGWPAPQVVRDLAGHERCVTQITLR
jgi:release factor glutamine methyltransferase